MQAMQPSNPNNLFVRVEGGTRLLLRVTRMACIFTQLTLDLHSVQTFDFHETRLVSAV